MNNHLQLWRNVDRDFTDEENMWISKLLSVDFDGRDILLQQLQTARVTSTCGCGCKTIDIQINKDCTKFSSTTRVPVEMTASMSDDVPVVFYLHVVGGYVNELEVFRADSHSIMERINLSDAVVHVNVG